MTISVLKRKIADEFNRLTTLEEQLEFIVEMGLELSLEEGEFCDSSYVMNHVCFRGVEAMDVKLNPLKCGRLSHEDLLQLSDLSIVIHGYYAVGVSSNNQINFEL